METLTVALADTCPVLLGSSSFRAFGLTSVEVTRKKMSSRKTMSVMDDIEMPASTLVKRLMAIILRVYSASGACSCLVRAVSRNSTVVFSILKTRLEMREVR